MPELTEADLEDAEVRIALARRMPETVAIEPARIVVEKDAPMLIAEVRRLRICEAIIVSQAKEFQRIWKNMYARDELIERLREENERLREELDRVNRLREIEAAAAVIASQPEYGPILPGEVRRYRNLERENERLRAELAQRDAPTREFDAWMERSRGRRADSLERLREQMRRGAMTI